MERGGRLVHHRDAWPGAVYGCPGCGEDLLVYAGPIRAKHFRHRAERGCGGEGAVHRAAKRLVLSVFSRWRRGLGPPPKLVQPCPGCRRPVSSPLACPPWARALPEYSLGAGCRADVALVDGRALRLAIEIRVSNAVSVVKRRALAIGDFPWLELEGEALIAAPWEWRVLDGAWVGRACSPECEIAAMRERLRQAFERDRLTTLVRLARETGTPLPGPPWEAAPTVCWRCAQAILVFRWPGHAPWSDRTPPNPRPKTLHRSFSRHAGRWYWANACPWCHHVQSDRALYLVPDAPFAGSS